MRGHVQRARQSEGPRWHVQEAGHRGIADANRIVQASGRKRKSWVAKDIAKRILQLRWRLLLWLLLLLLLFYTLKCRRGGRISGKGQLGRQEMRIFMIVATRWMMAE